MISLPRFSVENPVLVNLFMVAILVGGVYSGLTIVREMTPESRPNRVLVTTPYPGATPSEVEKGITLKIEEQIKDVHGVDKIISKINEGRSTISVELESGFSDIDQAVNDIEAAIATIPSEDFPEDALETRVAKFDPRWPVISVSVFGMLDDKTLKTVAEDIREDILTLSGITDVVITGTRKDEISVEVTPDKLVEFGLSFMDVAKAVSTANLDLPGGQVRTLRSNVAVRTLGEKDRGEDLYDIVVRSDPQGRVVRIRDVATIVDGLEDVDVAARFRGQPAVRVIVYKTSDQDALHIAAMIRALVAGKMGKPLVRSWDERLAGFLTGHDEIKETYERFRNAPCPAGVGVAAHTDLSEYVQGRLDLLKKQGFYGLILVALSLLVFLHWRVAFWVMMGLIIAICGSLICMQLLGQTLNLITMFGLIVVLGLLVDDAIIVGEHVYAKVEQGMDPKLAAIQATEEVTWPVVCAILTTIIAFVPLMFIDGQLGSWLGVLPIIVCAALSVSLIEALTMLPAHLAHNLRANMFDPASKHAVRKGRLAVLLTNIRHIQETYAQQRLRMLYEVFLRKSVSYRYITMAALMSALIVMGGTVLGDHVPWVFLQHMDSDLIVAKLRMEVGTPIKDTLRATKKIETVCSSFAELENVYSLLGTEMDDDGLIAAPQSHLAQVFIELIDSEKRQRSSDEIVKEIRARTSDIPGVEKLSYNSLSGGPTGAAIQLEITGDDVDQLMKISEEIQTQLAGFDGVYDILDDFDAGRREVQVELLDSARAIGLTTESLATQVRAAFYGFEARKIQRGREDVKIMVRYPPEHRKKVYDIESMWIATPSGHLVPFGEVARFVEGTGFASINRKDQSRAVTVRADVDDNVTKSSRVMAELEHSFPDIYKRYPGVQLAWGGQKLETQKSFESLKKSSIFALLMIYVILAALFRSYLQPLLVMAVIPFGVIGAIIGHLVMGYPLTVMSLIGLVALTGIVVNDSMILVTFTNRRIASGSSVLEAVIEGGKGRLRPILLTSATTVLGVAPLLLEQSFQAKFLIPMALTISAGLIFATVLTLIAVPSLYMIAVDFKRIFGQLVSWIIGREWTPQTVASEVQSHKVR